MADQDRKQELERKKAKLANIRFGFQRSCYFCIARAERMARLKEKESKEKFVDVNPSVSMDKRLASLGIAPIKEVMEKMEEREAEEQQQELKRQHELDLNQEDSSKKTKDKKTLSMVTLIQ